MAKRKKEKVSLLLYYDYKDQFELLDDNQLRKLIYAMIDFDQTGKCEKLDKITNMAFASIKNRLELDKKNWETTCKQNQKNIQDYWDKVKNQEDTNVYNRIRMNTIATDIEKEIEKDIEIDKEKETTTTISSSIGSRRSSFVFDFVIQEFGKPLSKTLTKKIEKWLDKFDEDVVKYAFEIAVMNDKKTFSYVEGILNNWEKQGYKKLSEIKNKKKKNNENNLIQTENGGFQLI